MKEKNIILLSVSIIILLVVICGANTGFADEATINIDENRKNLSSDFDVSFNKDSKYLDKNIIITGPRTVSLKQVVLNEVGECKTFSIPIVNSSNNVSAKIYPKVFNTNTEYFEVTCDISKSVLKAKSDEAIVKITVQLKKMPLYSDENTEFEIEIISEAIY